MEGIETLQRWMDESSRIVFFGGAGVSTESGIPDFRSVDGLYHQQYAFPPETILSRSFYLRKPEEFYRFYRNKISPMFPPRCRFTPTCSAYAMEAIEKYGAAKGGFLTARRLLRCNPFYKGDYFDPVP